MRSGLLLYHPGTPVACRALNGVPRCRACSEKVDPSSSVGCCDDQHHATYVFCSLFSGACCRRMPYVCPPRQGERNPLRQHHAVFVFILFFRALAVAVCPTCALHARTSEIRSATPTLWEVAALGDVEHVSRACLDSARSSKDKTGTPWACPGVNRKTPGLGFTPLHACVAGLAAVARGVDVSRPCTPPRPRGQANAPSRPSLYARLARGYGGGRPECTRGHRSSDKDQTTEAVLGSAGLVGNHVGVCRALLSAAADVQALDTRCRTPLALAAAAGSLEVNRLLKKTEVFRNYAVPNVST